MNVFIVIFRLLFEENKERKKGKARDFNQTLARISEKSRNLDSKTRTSADTSHHDSEDKNDEQGRERDHKSIKFNRFMAPAKS